MAHRELAALLAIAAACGSGRDPASSDASSADAALAAGDGGAPIADATSGWPDVLIDGDPPDTTILAGGPPAASLPFSTFEFEADEPASFECSLDGAAFSPCDTPISYADLAYGAHEFRVRAIDLANNVDATPASFAWSAAPFEYGQLSETGLYADVASKSLMPDVIEFAPTHPLWSDGAGKTRWIRLPPGTAIDTADMDAWELPIGTQLWKEFRAPDGTLIETRLIERRRSGGNMFGWEDYVWAGAFRWRLDETDADFVPGGAQNVNGTSFDIPPVTACELCHRGQPGFALGLTAIQLSRSGGPAEVTLGWLAAEGLLSDPPPSGALYPVPGSAAEKAALGFLLGNCSHCHNPDGWAFPVVPTMDLLLRTDETTVVGSRLFETTVGVGLVSDWTPPPSIKLRIAPGDADRSALVFRASARDAATAPPGVRPDQMPPLATEIAPTAQIAALRAWIEQL